MRLIIFQCLIGLPLLTLAQVKSPSEDTAKGGKIVIDHVGILIEDLAGYESVKWISNGFQLRIDSTYIYGDSAIIIGDNRIFAYDSIIIQQGDSLAVFTDTLYYTRDDDIAELKGEVVLKQGSKQLWTTDLTYHLGERYGEYHKGGVFIDKDLQVNSVTGIYRADLEEVLFKDSVFVLHPKFNLASDSLKYLAAEKRVLFTGPTNIYTEEAKIYCESGYYNLETEESEFSKDAQYSAGDKLGTATIIRYLASNQEVLMIGDVHVQEKDRVITGDSLRYMEQTGDTWIKGNPARYRDSTSVIVSPEIFYNEKTKKVMTKGGGEIRDGDQIIRAEHFILDQTTGYGRAEGNVLWSDTTNKIGIQTDVLVSSKDEEYMLAYTVDQRPRFYTLVDGDTLYIAADTLNMFTMPDTTASPDTIRMMRAFHDVRLYKSDMQGRTDSLVFQGRDSIFTFYGNPVLWSDSTQFKADSIHMTLRNKQIHEIILRQKAMIISEILKTYYDQIKGKTIVAQFDSSEVKDMYVTGNAESIYYTKDNQAAFIGVNRTICSRMHFTFQRGQIRALRYYGENSSSMLPMFSTDHQAMRLEGFEWREDERPWSLQDLLK